MAAKKKKQAVVESFIFGSLIIGIGSTLIHALIVILAADQECASEMAPFEILWGNAFPRIVVRKLQNSTGFSGQALPLSLGITSCRFDLVKETFANENELGKSNVELPQSLTHWVRLEKLDLRGNNVKRIPIDLLEMKTLTTVLFEGNPIHTDLNLSRSRSTSTKTGPPQGPALAPVRGLLPRGP